jgi:hypothetical protein
MTRDEQRVIRPAAGLGRMIFWATVVALPPLWPMGALIVLNAIQPEKRND